MDGLGLTAETRIKDCSVAWLWPLHRMRFDRDVFCSPFDAGILSDAAGFYDKRIGIDTLASIFVWLQESLRNWYSYVGVLVDGSSHAKHHGVSRSFSSCLIHVWLSGYKLLLRLLERPRQMRCRSIGQSALRQEHYSAVRGNLSDRGKCNV